MRTEKSVSMGIFRIVNYILITAMVAQFNLFVAEDAYLRLCITVHMHQSILARGDFWRPRIQFLTPINHTFSNLSIRTTISPEDFFQKFDLRIQKTAFGWAHLDISNRKKGTFSTLSISAITNHNTSHIPNIKWIRQDLERSFIAFLTIPERITVEWTYFMLMFCTYFW